MSAFDCDFSQSTQPKADMSIYRQLKWREPANRLDIRPD